MLITPSPASLSRYVEFLAKLSNYLLGIALLCYLTGFAVTNMYLGSLGIVNLDILRARYILAGFLFLLFVGGIAYLTHGLIRTLRINRHMSARGIIGKAIWYSAQTIVLLLMAIFALAIFAGIRGTTAGLSQYLSAASWSKWLETEPARIFQQTLWIFGIVMVALVIGLVVVLAINPSNKYGIRESRRQLLGNSLRNLTKSWQNILGAFFGIFLVMFVLYLVISLISLIGNLNSARFQAPEGWAQYFGGIVIIYLFLAVFLTFIALFPSSPGKKQEDDTMPMTSVWLYLTVLAIFFIVPLYTLGIYPNLPQQLGGGKMLPVEAVITSNELKPYFSDPSMETYLIDRTSNSSLFLLTNKDRQTAKIMEVANGLIQSITYSLPP
jgi:drug/metabolite transporter (DMT)-like permease